MQWENMILVTETDLGLIHDPGILKENRPISPHLWFISVFLMYSYFIFLKYYSQGREVTENMPVGVLYFSSVIFKSIFPTAYIKINLSVNTKIKP